MQLLVKFSSADRRREPREELVKVEFSVMHSRNLGHGQKMSHVNTVLLATEEGDMNTEPEAIQTGVPGTFLAVAITAPIVAAIVGATVAAGMATYFFCIAPAAAGPALV